MRTRSHLASAVIATFALAAAATAQSGLPVPMVLYAYRSQSPNSNLVLSRAGDVDGDGVVDFAVGDPEASFGLASNGSVRIRSGRDGSVIQEVLGTQAHGRLGYRVAEAGDVDGDGHPDLIAAGRELDPSNGAVTTARVVSGADGHTLLAIPGVTDAVFESIFLCSARHADVDGDGFADVIVGSPEAAPGGSVRVYSGASHQLLFDFVGVSGDALGVSVASADLDGDGHCEIIAGDSSTLLPNGHVGCARVFSGADGSLLATLDGPPKIAAFGVVGSGQLVCATDDLDGDGAPDVGLVIDGYGDNSYLHVVSGKTFAPIVDAGSGSNFNWIQSVDGAGDFNGDLVPDLLVGTQSGDIPSAVRIYSGVDGALLKNFQLGWNGVGLGDIDNDGFPDLCVNSRVVSGAPSHWTKWGFPDTYFNAPLETDAYATFGPGTPCKLALRFTQPGSAAWLVLGLNEIQLPFHNTTLWASPDFVTPIVPADAEGEIQVFGQWPAAVPSGFSFVAQFLTMSPVTPGKIRQGGGLQAKVP